MKLLSLKQTSLFLLFFILVLSACSDNGDSNDGSGADTYEWSIGYNTVEDSIRGVAAQEFKEVIEEESNGNITIELFPNEELGSDNEMIESVQVGALDLQYSSGGAMAETIPQFSVMNLPFMFKNVDEAHAAIDGPTGDTLTELANEEGFQMLTSFSIGFAQITTNKNPVNSPEDLQGLSIRSPNEPVPIKTFEELGSQVTTLPFTELYLGLSQGVIDGQFNPLTAIDDSNFYEEQSYLAMTDIIFYHSPLIMNQDLWEGLDEDVQEMVINAANKASDVARDFEKETEEDVLSKIEDEFEEVTNPEKEAFQKAVEPVYEYFEDEIGKNNIDELQEFLEDIRN